MGTAALLASVTAAIYFLVTGSKKPRQQDESAEKKPVARADPAQAIETKAGQ
jgi:hypothetical protein